jgi:O-methyltransferase
MKKTITKFMGTSFAIKCGTTLRAMFNKIGVDVRRVADLDVPKHYREIFDTVCLYTMTSRERVYSLISSVEYIVKNDIPGAIVECGVWKGGSSMACLLTLKHLNANDRDIYLYDTFAGMPEPTSKDGLEEHAIYNSLKDKSGNSSWCRSLENEVYSNLEKCNYPMSKIKLVKGLVEETIPAESPEKIAILRLDTDWYSSTFHELTHLYPKLQKSGILIIDDYGTWQGCRTAVDEYFKESTGLLFFHRIDANGRLVVKVV